MIHIPQQNPIAKNLPIAQGVQQARMLLAALISGIVMFAIVAHFVGPIDIDDDAGLGDIFRVSSFCLAGGALFGWLVVRTMFRKRLHARVKAGEIGPDVCPQEVLQEALVKAALFEAGGLFACIAYLMSHQQIFLFFIALAVVAMLLFIPSERTVREVIQDAKMLP